MDVELESTATLKVLGELTIKLISESKEIVPGDITSMALGPLFPANSYAIDTFRSTMEVLSVCAQLRHSAAYVAQFRSTPKLKKSGVSRYSHIIYHIENHSITIRMVSDRVLQFINIALRLGNSNRNFTPQVILQNEFAKSSVVVAPVKKIEQVLKSHFPSANILLHQTGHSEPELSLAEMIYRLEDWGIDHLGDVDLPNSLAMSVMDDFVVEKEKELLNFNQRIFKAVAEFLDLLGPECERQYAELRAQQRKYPM